MTIFLSQGVEYLGFLDAKLRDLQGYSTLAHELIQNADDSLATSMVFDVRDDALIVENNSSFSDCGAVEDDECSWKDLPSKEHRCDFHRFRKVAGGDKRQQSATIGAFGIGFISVYQITDRPELQSGDRHWIIRPAESEDRRIEATVLPHTYDGTRFILPWATDPKSTLRKRLHREYIHVQQVSRELIEILATVLPNALLFLTNIRQITLRNNGLIVKTLLRTDNEKQMDIEDGNQTVHWRVVRGSFQSQALRAQYPQIEEKRSANVSIALGGHGFNQEGLFCAFLPTEHQTGFPFYINADFYTSTDRKRILLSDDYEGEWNRAAIASAATLVANVIPQLPEFLDHSAVWELFERLKIANKKALQRQIDPIFAEFWSQAESKITTSQIVYVWPTAWHLPNGSYLLKDQQEERFLKLFKDIGLKIVHPDLRRNYSLLREVGVGVLDLLGLAKALRSAGLDRLRQNTPDWILDPATHTILGDAITSLANHPAKQEALEDAKKLIAQCSIALNDAGQLCPPAQLYRSTPEAVLICLALSLEHRLVAEVNPPAIAALAEDLTLDAMLKLLESLPEERFKRLWVEHKDILLTLIDWFIDQIQSIRSHDSFKRRIRDIPMWPSGQEVYSLNDLVIPGDFDDVFQSTVILDREVCSRGRKSGFFWDLGFKMLRIQDYVRDHVSQAFKVSHPPEASRCRALTILLAQRLGELQDDDQVQRVLSKSAFIECQDGQFRKATEVYFDDPARAELFATLPLVHLPSDHPEAVSTLYTWLGVARVPRLSDIVARIKHVVMLPATSDRRRIIAQFFEYVGHHIETILPADRDFEELRSLRWLPVDDIDDTTWYEPSAIYATYQKHLFSSQARFLALDSKIQIRSLIDRLGINPSPSVKQVVQHLRRHIEQHQEISTASHRALTEIYKYLNDNAEQPEILDLKTTACLIHENVGYVHPNRAFLGSHPFGRYRYRLHHTLHQYQKLLKRLDVHHEPVPIDARKVLQELSQDFGGHEKPLDKEAYSIVIECWKLLANALEQSMIGPEFLLNLREVPSIPNEQYLLQSPESMFFDDRPGVADRLPEFKQRYTIVPILGVWHAMKAAGVQQLSKAVNVTLIECANPTPAEDLLARILERRHLIERILEVYRATTKSDLNINILNEIRIDRVSTLTIKYLVRVADHPVISEPDAVAAYFDIEHKILYVQAQAPRLWPALARELAVALNAQSDSVQLAAALKDVLSSDTTQIAAEVLNELGYANLITIESQASLGIADTETRVSETSSDETYSIFSYQRSLDTRLSGGESPNINLKSDEILDTEMFFREDSSSILPVQQHVSATSFIEESPSISNNQSIKPPDNLTTKPDRSAAYHAGESQDDSEFTTPRETESESTMDTRRDAAKTPHTSSQRQRGRLRTYVTMAQTQGENKASAPNTRAFVDLAGIESVVLFEREAGRYPQVMPHENPGYDIQSCDETGTVIRYIEVKSVSGSWDSLGVSLSTTQFSTAQALRGEYWLYIVEQAETEFRYIYRIQDPAARVDQFFYDDGWRSVAEDGVQN